MEREKGESMKRCYRALARVMVLVVGMATAAGAAEEISWATQADSMRGQIGQQVAYYCPPGGSFSSRLWGTGTYTDDSSICTAAVHAGLITRYNGGNVVIEIRPGQPHYRGSHKNGLSSKDYGSYNGSFVFVSARGEQDNYRDDHHHGVPVPRGYDPMESRPHKKHRNEPSAVSEISWTISADSLRGQIGHRVTYFCPAGGTLSSRLWGSRVYTDDSSICTAAVHAGLITTYNGGEVTIEIMPGQQSYHGSRHNGVASKKYGSFSGSFMFVRQ
jgi:hypothetical protein